MSIISSNNAGIAKVERIFHPVGQGGFYTETIGSKMFVYDCGGNSSKSMEHYLNSCIVKENTIDKLFISHLHWDHINGLEYLFDKKSKLAIKELYLPQLTPNRIIETTLYNALNFSNREASNANKILSQIIAGIPNVLFFEVREDGNMQESLHLSHSNLFPSGNSIEISSNRTNKWVYIPYNPLRPKPNFQKITDSNVRKEWENAYKIKDMSEQADKVLQLVKKYGITKCKEIYKILFGGIHNSQSMTVFSGLLNRETLKSADTNMFRQYACERVICKLCKCFRSKNPNIIPSNFLYTGDLEITNIDSLIDFYTKHEVGNLWETLSGIQIPHHGSRNNYDSKLYLGKCYAIASAGTHNRYHHPNIDTLINIFRQGCMPYVVTEDDNTKLSQQFRFI